MTGSFSQPIFSWIENRSKNAYYPFYLTSFLFLASIFFAFPKILYFDPASVAWQTTILKSQDLTNSLLHLPGRSGEAKKIFRLTVPVIMRIFSLAPLGVLVLQVIAGLATSFFSYKLCLRITKDAVCSTFVTAGLAFLYFGRAAYFDGLDTLFDSFAYFFLVCSLFSNSFVGIFMFSSLAAWTDERAFIALGIVFLYHQYVNKFPSGITTRELLIPTRRSFSVFIAVIAYVVIRYFLVSHYQMNARMGGVGFAMLVKNLPFLGVGMWTFLEGFWLIYILAIIQSLVNKEYLTLLVFAIPLAVFTLIAGCVADITRSGSYLVPIIFFLVNYVERKIKNINVRELLFLCFLVCFLFPATFVGTDWPMLRMWYQASSIFYIAEILMSVFS